MATAEEASPYAGGGAGGKFRKKPFRRQTTPYDRPPTALRVSNINTNTNNTTSWLTKLVVEPASKLISYGAGRFFGSVLRRGLPPPPEPQPQPKPPEVNADVTDADLEADLDGQDDAQEPVNDCRQAINSSSGQDGAQEPGAGDSRQPINSSSSNVVLELEQLFKKKTFNRSEIVHLTELLQSRAVDASLEDARQKNEENASEFGRHQEFASGFLKGNRNVGIRSSAVVSTPVHNSKVLEDGIATPAELAKAYMGSRPSKVSPSELGMRGQLGREEAGLLTNLPFASKSPIMSLTKKSLMSLGAQENGFVTPRSRSRSSIYNMARTPYSRAQPASVLKGSGSNNNGYAGPSTSSYLPPVENNEKFESQPVTLKRRSSVFDDEVASVGPMRRIRQKSNLSAPRFHHTAQGVGVGSHSKQKPGLMGDRRNVGALKNIAENENQSVPSSSYARVPSRSSEVAAKILQQLENVSPKEKSSDSKVVAAREKWPLKSTPSMLSGQALRSREDEGSSKFLLDDQIVGDNAMLPSARDSFSRKQVNAEENHHKASVFSSGPSNYVLNNDSAVTLRTSRPSIGTADLVNNGASQPLQKKRAFRMNAEEDSSEQDDVQFNGIAARSLSENNGPMGSLLTDSKRASDEEYKLLKTTESEDKSPSGLIPRGTNEFSPGAITIGERTSVIAVPASEETRAAAQSESFVSSFAAYDKPKEANNSPLFSFSSKVGDKFPPVPAESTKRAEPEPESSSRLDNMSASFGSQVKTFDSDKGFQLNLPKPGDVNGKRDDVSSAASNGPFVSSFSHVPFSTNQISTGSAPLFSSSSSITNFVSTAPSTSTTFSGSIFGSTAKPLSSAGPVFKFGSAVDPSTAVSAASTSGISEVADQRTKVEINPSSGSSNSSHSTVAALSASSSGNSIFGLSSSTGNNLQGSLFGSSNSKSLMSGFGSVTQGSSSQLFSATSAPAFNVNTSTSLGSSPSPTFGFGSSASSSGPNPFAPVGGPTSSSFKFGTSASEGPSSAASFTTSATPGIFSFGLSSSSSTTTTVAATPPTFNFGAASSSGINTGSSLSSGTSGIFNFGGSTSASSSSSGAPSTALGSVWQSQKSPVFGSTFASPPPSTTGFAFGAPSTSSNAAPPMVFSSSTVAQPSSVFPFTTSSASALSSPALSNTQPIFGNSSPMGGGFAASPGNDQMNAEDSMAEDPVPSSVFGQPSVSPSPGFAFGSTVPSQPNPFLFSGQQNQGAPQSPSPFQATGSLEFNAGGSSFSLGSGGGDKSNRKIVRINRNKNRKK